MGSLRYTDVIDRASLTKDFHRLAPDGGPFFDKGTPLDLITPHILREDGPVAFHMECSGLEFVHFPEDPLCLHRIQHDFVQILVALNYVNAVAVNFLGVVEDSKNKIVLLDEALELLRTAIKIWGHFVRQFCRCFLYEFERRRFPPALLRFSLQLRHRNTVSKNFGFFIASGHLPKIELPTS